MQSVSSEKMWDDCLSIRQFCDMHDISWGHYFNMRKRGEGPDEMRAGRRVIITPEAATAWRRARIVAT
jgi:hypothetical protein